MDVARSASQGSHYRVDAIYLIEKLMAHPSHIQRFMGVIIFSLIDSPKY